jgi:hypothetical protein
MDYFIASLTMYYITYCGFIQGVAMFSFLARAFSGTFSQLTIERRAIEFLAIDLLIQIDDPEVKELKEFFWQDPSPHPIWEQEFHEISRELANANSRQEQRLKIRAATVDALNRWETNRQILEKYGREDLDPKYYDNLMIAKTNYMCLRMLSGFTGDTFTNDWCDLYLEHFRRYTSFMISRKEKNHVDTENASEADLQKLVEQIKILDDFMQASKFMADSVKDKALNGHNWDYAQYKASLDDKEAA